MTDEDIDTSDIPELSDDFFAKAKLRLPDSPGAMIAVRLDTDTLEWFQHQGDAAEKHMAAALRIYAESHRYADSFAKASLTLSE
jgi:uncharacterized protein (DUF4415 family)